jgi:hypothetical protein
LGSSPRTGKPSFGTQDTLRPSRGSGRRTPGSTATPLSPVSTPRRSWATSTP